MNNRKCFFCLKTLKPNNTLPRYSGTHGYRGNGIFCSQRCGFNFAMAWLQAAVVVQGKENKERTP